MQKKLQRVAVTGLGMATPLGCEKDIIFSSMLDSQHGFRLHDVGDGIGECVCAPFAADIDLTKHLAGKEIRKYDDFINYGIYTALEAVADSGLELTNLDLARCGVAVGSGLGGLGSATKSALGMAKRGVRGISPFFMPAYLINVLPGLIAMKFGFQGPNYSMVSACATGLHNIGSAAWAIAHGQVDVMLAGASDVGTTSLSVAGFKAMKALTASLDVMAASRPWDVDRDGFVIADGSAVLVLENYEQAVARGANIYCVVEGFGMSADAYHVTKPPAGGEGASLAMSAALQDAQLEAAQIDLVCAHGTSTPAGDSAEALAIERVFGVNPEIMVTSTKSLLGHSLGAAGALETALCALMLQEQVVLPTAHTKNLEREYNFKLVRDKQSTSIKRIINNSFGFGGTNAALILANS